MEDYITREVNNRRAFGALTWVVTMVKNMKARRELRKLWGMSDYHLADIGLTRANLARDLNRSLISNWDFEKSRETRLAHYDTKFNRRFLPLSTPEGGQTYLPDTMWLPRDEYRDVVTEARLGMATNKAKPMAAPISTYSMAVAPVSSLKNALMP
jgi:uncharacterized protein YjiS (DUF1127 family)